MDTILGAPAWIQEALYIDLGEKLKEKIPTFDLSYSLADSYPIYRPKITFKGKQELQNHDMGLDFNVYKYLNSLMEELRVIDIMLNNFCCPIDIFLFLAYKITTKKRHCKGKTQKSSFFSKYLLPRRS